LNSFFSPFSQQLHDLITYLYASMDQVLTKSDFTNYFRSVFGFELTTDQEAVLHGLNEFTFNTHPYPMFILKGYAGTGKTSLLGAYVKVLQASKIKSRLLAPTGRAAKVLGNRAGNEAFTIHKQIYRRQDGTDSYSPISLMPNLHTNTVFIVDEASMIAEYTVQQDGNIGRDLLSDLVEYVYSGKNCKMILLGDEGQLPPVGSSESPALQTSFMTKHFPKLEVSSYVLSEVLRQQLNSGILFNATNLRATVFPEVYDFDFSYKDFVHLSGEELQEELESCYSKYGSEETIVITRSNKRANLYNQNIRGRILWFEEKLCQNDCLMVVKNNYYWLQDESKAGFIANGEMLRVKRIRRFEHEYGFDFARVIVSLEDYPDEPELEVLLLMETIDSEGPSLSRDRMKELFFAIEKDHMDEKNKRKRYEKILKDPYFNALQVKYAYAVTCHKSQGGQWSAVFIDPGFLPEGSSGEDFYRWIYTAITRATEKVYLINITSTKTT
jgi:exodeoxyribonuclease V